MEPLKERKEEKKNLVGPPHPYSKNTPSSESGPSHLISAVRPLIVGRERPRSSLVTPRNPRHRPHLGKSTFFFALSLSSANPTALPPPLGGQLLGSPRAASIRPCIPSGEGGRAGGGPLLPLGLVFRTCNTCYDMSGYRRELQGRPGSLTCHESTRRPPRVTVLRYKFAVSLEATVWHVFLSSG